MMKTITVQSEEAMELAITEASRDGLRLASCSNAGLPAGSIRLTFLPLSAFTDTPQPKE